MKKVSWLLAITLVFAFLVIGCSKQELEQAKADFQKTKAELEQTKTELQKTKTDLEQTKTELQKTKTDLGETLSELSKIQTERTKLEQMTSGPGRYRVELVKMNLAELDWSVKDNFPVGIMMTIYKDGNSVFSCEFFTKRPGELSSPNILWRTSRGGDWKKHELIFEIEYSPSAKYTIEWQGEVGSIILSTHKYPSWGTDAEPGNWPFNTRLKYQQNSWFEFSATKIK
jgi:outer membrane lipoprotein-sorting protein